MGRLQTVRLVLLLALVDVGTFVAAMSRITGAFEFYNVVPDVVNKAPRAAVKVQYPGGVQVNAGNELSPKKTEDKPDVCYRADGHHFYTLIMVDPDAPSHQDPILRDLLHWLVGNVVGCWVSRGEEQAAYISPAPPQGTGLHRYVFLVYKQPGKIAFTEPHLSNVSTDHRTGFSVEQYAKKYNLGNPIAGNLFWAQWDG